MNTVLIKAVLLLPACILIAMLPVFHLNVSAGDSTAVQAAFTPGTGAPPLLDPENPVLVRPPAAGDVVTNQAGALTLDLVPAFSFGKDTPLTARPVAWRTNSSLPLLPFAQVSDLRGSGGGWRLLVRASGFRDQGGAPSLPGARLILSGGAAVSSNPDVSGTPAVNAAEILFSDDSAAFVSLARAESDKGMGAWCIRWYGDYVVSLWVPAVPIAAGVHSATLTWQLQDAP